VLIWSIEVLTQGTVLNHKVPQHNRKIFSGATTVPLPKDKSCELIIGPPIRALMDHVPWGERFFETIM
jgi:hypothetical protein